ncbi:MAG: cupin domain-containing protein [Anaerolineae bacterium]|jgi:quercetin dioxygenase-like cupin family protein
MKVVRSNKTVSAQPFPGVTRETLAHGGQAMLTRNSFAAGAVLAAHAHPHEQVTYVIAGELRLTVGDKTLLLKPGDSVCVPPNVAHAAAAEVDTVVLDAFAPPREDFL